ncbi:MAG: GDP-mannose 4,6-dehydratase [Verrucomicrobia bacterium]|nr:GDP-mannose 4,6-dehydratase [Verrucomicrobiota bacterium]
MRKKAFLTGVTGQDGSYLAELLLEKNYEVHGLVRRSSTANLHRINHLLDGQPYAGQFFLHEGDLTDSTSLERIIGSIKPDEVYNLAAMSDVKISFDIPEYTGDVDGLGTLRLLESIRKNCPNARFYQASTSELFGKVRTIPQNEQTPFYPRSPYGVAKLYAYWAVVNYREAYGLYACNGILFNHESPRRGENFVSRKITRTIARIQAGIDNVLLMGNLEAKRDWGYARDFVEGMWLMLQQATPEDFVLATGKTTTVKQFIEMAFEEVGVSLSWEGKGVEEKGYDAKTGHLRVAVSPEFFRPSEVDLLVGDSTKARTQLNWSAKTELRELVRMMVRADLERVSHADTKNMALKEV